MIPVHSIAPPLLVEKSNDTSNYKMTKALSQFSRIGWTPGARPSRRKQFSVGNRGKDQQDQSRLMAKPKLRGMHSRVATDLR
jgi:hypothetical protein